MKANLILFLVVMLAIVAGLQASAYVDRKRAARAVRSAANVVAEAVAGAEGAEDATA